MVCMRVHVFACVCVCACVHACACVCVCVLTLHCWASVCVAVCSRENRGIIDCGRIYAQLCALIALVNGLWGCLPCAFNCEYECVHARVSGGTVPAHRDARTHTNTRTYRQRHASTHKDRDRQTDRHKHTHTRTQTHRHKHTAQHADTQSLLIYADVQ